MLEDGAGKGCFPGRCLGLNLASQFTPYSSACHLIVCSRDNALPTSRRGTVKVNADGKPFTSV